MGSASEAVLIYRTGQLGDTLVAMPAIRAIRNKHEHAHIVLLTDQHAAAKGYVSSWSVLAPTGWIDEVIFYSPRGRSRLAVISELIGHVGRLRRYRVSHVYNLVFRTKWLACLRDRLFFSAFLSGCEYVHTSPLPYPPKRDGTGALIAVQPEWRRLTAAVSPGGAMPKFDFPHTPDAATEAPDIALLPIGNATPVVAFAPGSKMSAKRWPEENFIALGRALLEATPCRAIVIVGGPEDAAVGDRLCAAWAGAGINLAGRLSVYGSAHVLSRCCLYVGNDTGTMHLAAMAGAKCVCVFSARDYPGLWEPYGAGHTILRRELPCSGCMLEDCEQHANACVRAISTQEVLKACCRVLGSNGCEM